MRCRTGLRTHAAARGLPCRVGMPGDAGRALPTSQSQEQDDASAIRSDLHARTKSYRRTRAAAHRSNARSKRAGHRSHACVSILTPGRLGPTGSQARCQARQQATFSPPVRALANGRSLCGCGLHDRAADSRAPRVRRREAARMVVGHAAVPLGGPCVGPEHLSGEAEAVGSNYAKRGVRAISDAPATHVQPMNVIERPAAQTPQEVLAERGRPTF
jgi:hypothetical protein